MSNFNISNPRMLKESDVKSHINDIIYGDAIVPFCDKRSGWVLPGRSFTIQRHKAEQLAIKINNMIRGIKG